MPSLEERVTLLETTLSQHIAETAPLKRDIQSLSDLGAKSFVSVNLQLNRLETTVNEHSALLKEHSALLKEHSAILNGHTDDLASLKDDVAQILKIVSGQNLK